MADKILASVIRTVVPVIVGVLVASAAKVGFHLTDDTFTGVVTTGVTAAYYTIARGLEVYVGPRWGWLLGKAGAPKYVAQDVTVSAAVAPVVNGRSTGVNGLVTVGTAPSPAPVAPTHVAAVGWTCQQDDVPTKTV